MLSLMTTVGICFVLGHDSLSVLPSICPIRTIVWLPIPSTKARSTLETFVDIMSDQSVIFMMFYNGKSPILGTNYRETSVLPL